ncbi:MAG: hypothetical protein BMS9Abin26_0850 [Gammaproteobacteria bacterium]|nr:MAG: hypothetical protein BMS9Abin26_0850 [Gammaproteobacteria bacterium]
MPYFVYRNNPDVEIEVLSEHADYKQAKKEVTRLRTDRSEEQPGDEFRMIFAEDVKSAKRVLRTRRNMQSPLQEWEEKIG